MEQQSLPSFAAPIRAEVHASPLLLVWNAALSAVAWLAVGATLVALAAAAGIEVPGPKLAAVLTVAVPCLAAVAAATLRRRGRHRCSSRPGRFELCDDGCLLGRLPGGQPVAGSVCAIQRCGPFFTLQFARADGRSGPSHWTLAVDAIDRDARRRLAAWCRAGMPANFREGCRSISRNEGRGT